MDLKEMKTGKHTTIYVGVACFLLGLSIFPIANYNKPTALDAYRGWTHLRVTVEEYDILDTVVVYNIDRNTPKKRRDALKDQPVKEVSGLRELVQLEQEGMQVVQ